MKFQFLFIKNSRICPQPVLLSVNTQPFDTTISSSTIILDDDDDDERSSADLTSMCFICNTKTSESYVSLYETVSLHSKTQIYDFVWKFLNDKPSIRDDSIEAANSNWSLVCMQCLDKINNYDLACVTAAKLEQELRDDLALTEALYAPQQDIQESYQTEEMAECALTSDANADQNDATSADPINPLQILEEDNSVDASAHYVIELSDEENDQPQSSQNDDTIELSDDDDD